MSPRTPNLLNSASFTFRIDAELKAQLIRSSREDNGRPGQLLRDLVRRHLEERSRRAFEAEARRQSETIARRAIDPESDEAQVMREIDAAFEAIDFGRER